MAGILGIIDQNFRQENRVEIDSMLKCLLHESCYTSGTFVNEELGLSLGWVAHPGSFSEGMPVWNEAKSICLFFSGEDYQDRNAIYRSAAVGRETAADNVGYIIDLYEELGLKFLDRLNGWFSGLILDLRKAQAFLFNDRYGVGRICYHEYDGKFYFASEAKALLKVLPHLRKLDYKSLGEVFSCGSVLQNRTLFAGVSLLPGGSV